MRVSVIVNESPEDYVLQVIVAVGLRIINYMATARRHLPAGGVRACRILTANQDGVGIRYTLRSASCVLWLITACGHARRHCLARRAHYRTASTHSVDLQLPGIDG